jgi:hypothetical protein
LGDIGKFSKCGEPGREVFAIGRSAQQIPFQGKVLLDQTKARQKVVRALRVGKVSCASLALPGGLISICGKFEKSNALSGNTVARLLGPDVDPYEGFLPNLDAVDIDRLCANQQLSRRSVRAALIQDAVRARWSTSFRFCRSCLGNGYHTIAHQFEGLNVCPHIAVLWSRHVAAAATRYRIELTSNFLRRNIAAPTILRRTRMSS